ncbi:MAG: hypothetical protein SFU21_14445 [Flavihumibacter sp.]|nr:hypothetical protein [Flavihumibacter sp.]
MKKIASVIICLFLLIAGSHLLSCKKGNTSIYVSTGTVMREMTNSISPGSYYILLDNPNAQAQPFVCKDSTVFIRAESCKEGVCITNLPASLKVIGKRIRFSHYKDLQLHYVYSSLYVPHFIEVYDAIAVN